MDSNQWNKPAERLRPSRHFHSAILYDRCKHFTGHGHSFWCERLEERNAFLIFSTFLSSPLTLGVGLGWGGVGVITSCTLAYYMTWYAVLRSCALAAHMYCHAGYVANTSASGVGLGWRDGTTFTGTCKVGSGGAIVFTCTCTCIWRYVRSLGLAFQSMLMLRSWLSHATSNTLLMHPDATLLTFACHFQHVVDASWCYALQLLINTTYMFDKLLNNIRLQPKTNIESIIDCILFSCSII